MRFFSVVACGVILLLSACVSQPAAVSVNTGIPAEFGAISRAYHDAAARGEPVYRLNSDESDVRILVYRGGALARLGHDHTLTTHQVQGFARLPKTGMAQADVYIAVASLIVDNPAARKSAGFSTEPTSSDIEGTYRNMLGALDVQRYPFVRLHVAIAVAELFGQATDPQVAVDLTLHGMTRQLIIPVSVLKLGNGYHVTGTFRIRQTDFDIKPFSLFGGALTVRDELKLSFDLGFDKI